MSGEKPGLLHLYCGDGKGKTTAAIGLAVRAAGAGLKVAFVQFLKDGNSSELQVLENLPGVTVLSGKCEKGFVKTMNPEQRKNVAEECLERLAQIRQLDQSGSYHLIVLDEALGAISTGSLCQQQMMDFLRQRNGETEIVLTGRNPSPELIELADYVSEIKMVKHPYTRGIPARRGIEW